VQAYLTFFPSSRDFSTDTESPSGNLGGGLVPSEIPMLSVLLMDGVKGTGRDGNPETPFTSIAVSAFGGFVASVEIPEWLTGPVMNGLSSVSLLTNEIHDQQSSSGK
jgi:hypothetical protein